MIRKRNNRKRMNRGVSAILVLTMISVLIGCGNPTPTIGGDVVLESTEESIEAEEISNVSTEREEYSTVSTETDETEIDDGNVAGGDKPVEATPKPTTTPHTHSYTEAATVQATCSTAGEKKLTCSCGDTKTEAIPATGNHNWVAQTTVVHHEALGHVEQTQVQVGTTETRHEYECAVCGFRSDTAAGVSDHCVAFVGTDRNHAGARTIIYDYPGEPIYENQSQWVVDQEAYDSEEIVGYKCSVCGAIQ